MRGKGSADQLHFDFSFVPQVQARGDGSFVVTPGKPMLEMTPIQVARLLSISRSSVYALIDRGALEYRRPLKKKILITAASVEAWRLRTSDPEFWP